MARRDQSRLSLDQRRQVHGLQVKRKDFLIFYSVSSVDCCIGAYRKWSLFVAPGFRGVFFWKSFQTDFFFAPEGCWRNGIPVRHGGNLRSSFSSIENTVIHSPRWSIVEVSSFGWFGEFRDSVLVHCIWNAISNQNASAIIYSWVDHCVYWDWWPLRDWIHSCVESIADSMLSWERTRLMRKLEKIKHKGMTICLKNEKESKMLGPNLFIEPYRGGGRVMFGSCWSCQEFCTVPRTIGWHANSFVQHLSIHLSICFESSSAPRGWLALLRSNHTVPWYHTTYCTIVDWLAARPGMLVSRWICQWRHHCPMVCITYWGCTVVQYSMWWGTFSSLFPLFTFSSFFSFPWSPLN